MPRLLELSKFHVMLLYLLTLAAEENQVRKGYSSPRRISFFFLQVINFIEKSIRCPYVHRKYTKKQTSVRHPELMLHNQNVVAAMSRPNWSVDFGMSQPNWIVAINKMVSSPRRILV
jgi:hypothetical protein